MTKPRRRSWTISDWMLFVLAAACTAVIGATVLGCSAFPHTTAAVDAAPGDFWESVSTVWITVEGVLVGILRDLAAWF